MKDLTELKKNVEQLAEDEGKAPLEIITALQGAAAKIGNEELLDDLCELKWDYL